jgi:hypothetical protein
MTKRGRKELTRVEPVNVDTITLKELATKFNDLLTVLNGTRLKSDRAMTEEDAVRVIVGDLAQTPIQEAAETLKLSYMQVYTAKKGITFKHVHEELKPPAA